MNDLDLGDLILFGLNLQLNSIASVFFNLTVNDLINGYTDPTTELIEKNQPGSIYKSDKFHFLTAVLDLFTFIFDFSKYFSKLISFLRQIIRAKTVRYPLAKKISHRLGKF